MSGVSPMVAIAEALLARSPAGVLVYEGDSGRCQLANQAIADIVGGTVEALRLQSFREIDSWRESGLVELAESTLRDGAPRHRDATLRSSFGKTVSLDCFASRFDIEGKPHLMLVITDVTDYRRAAEELRRYRDHLEQKVGERTAELLDAMRQLAQQEARYRIVADHACDWEYWLGPEGTFIYCSPSCANVTGHAAEAFYADPDLLLRSVHPDDLAVFAEHRREAATRHVGGSLQFRVQHADGTSRWVHHVCQPIFDASGAYLGDRGSNTDVTETKLQQDLVLSQKREVEAILARTKRLEGIISICMYCKRINSDNRSWEQMEKYISDHSDALFSHGICPECYARHADD